MELIKNKLNKTTKGLLRLPPGFRFHPTDEELVVQYLKRKVLSCPLPASVIPELDVCKSNPWDLPGDTEQERYFFSTKEVKYPNGTRANRATESGYWKATGPDKKIVRQGNAATVGMKKTLVFYRGKPPKGARTDWVMHEYRLATPQNHDNDDSRISQDNWVLCRIFLKTRNKIKDNRSKSGCDDGSRDHGPVLYNFMGKKDDLVRRAESSSSSSSDGSSGITTTDIVDDRLSSNTSANSYTANFSNVFK